MGSSASSEQLNKSPSRNGKTPQPASARTTESRRRNRGFEEVEFQHNGQVMNNGSSHRQPPTYDDVYDDYEDYEQLPSGYSDDNHWQHTKHNINTTQRVVASFTPQQHQEHQDYILATRYQMQELQLQVQDDIIFETFTHQNGRDYPCIVQQGQRFYLDSWETQEWQPFPREWYNKGKLEREGKIEDESVSPPNQYNDQPSTSSRVVDRDIDAIDVSGGFNTQQDDREGILNHPTRGQIQTYMFEERQNVHYYFDQMSGVWVKMPISWEQHHEFVKPIVKQIKETCPAWSDKYDIIASLRASNYDLDDCIATYFTIGDTGVMDMPDRYPGGNAAMVKEKEDKIRSLEAKLTKLKSDYEEACRVNKVILEENEKSLSELRKLRDQLSESEIEAKTAHLRVVSMQQERPMTARPMTARPGTSRTRRPKTPEIETAPPEPEVLTLQCEPEPEVGPVIDDETLKAVNKDVKEVDKMNKSLKHLVKTGFEDLKQLTQQAMGGLKQLRSLDTNTSSELENIKVLYRKECLQRKILYNKIQELRGNIRVFCRCRRDDRVECSLQFPTDHEIQCTNPAGGVKKYKFDRVFTPKSTQDEVFTEVMPIITSCVDGYNVCLMAYGQTGSGKTYTMMGPSDNPGVNLRAVTELLKICNEREKIRYTLKVSLLEVYNENLQDLLTDKDSPNLDIRMQGKRLLVQGLTDVVVRNVDDIQAVMAKGDANRTTAATKMNSTSSRSHLLLMIFVEGVDTVSNATSYGSLTLVDLAGSERIAKTGATGQTLVEAAAINKSLTSLGQVFTSLRTNALHVPYRNSKLTHLLQSSLSGDAKACLFVNVSPDAENISESISSLSFGSNARQVALGKATQNVTKGQ